MPQTPQSPLPRRAHVSEEKGADRAILVIELALAGLVLTAVAIGLIGVGEMRGMRQCTQTIDRAIHAEAP